MSKFGVLKTKILKKLTESYSNQNKTEMKEILKMIKENKDFKELYLFYEEIENKYFEDRDTAKLYVEELNSILKNKSKNISDFCNKLNTKLNDIEINENEVQNIFTGRNNQSKVSVIAGLVEETLPQQKDLKPAFYVDFDLDIYSPTKYAFDYLMENNLIVPGTLIGYDDWGGTPGFEEFKDGESRAHKEILDKWGISMTKLYQNGYAYPHVQTLWIVDSLE